MRRCERGAGAVARGDPDATRTTLTFVRPARVEDAPAIARVFIEAWNAAYRGLVPDAFLDGFTLEERTEKWRARLAGDDLTLVVDDVSGYCRRRAVSRDEDVPAGTGEIESLYVDPKRLRRGLGGALLRVALEDLRRAGCDAVTLWVFVANAGARAFYERFGFAPDGTCQQDPGTGVPELRMRRELG
jgi:ribosomal protein S18 acetylase RimI-like enzyme